jgi:Taurine catabolism dioxygenase TauD, TfdA family
MKPQNDAPVAISALLATLRHRRWAHHEAEGADADSVATELDRVGNLLGTRTRGRAGAIEEIVRPQTTDDAHPRSLSVRYGLNPLPFHAELSHQPRPCRFLLLGCIDPGSPNAATLLLDWRTLGFSPEELHILESTPILVRTGRRSFYSTMLPSDRAFLRYDPGCLEAIDERGQAALRLVEHRLANGFPESHRWRQGDILVIDNWHVLHGRGPSEQDSGRRLMRILIDA